MATMEINKEYLGQLLLDQGFKTWFLYMFRVLEGKPFIVEPIHDDIFELFEEIHKRNIIRANLNVPHRSAKTTMCKYFIDYSLLKNPKCKFIYTSFNQNLLSDISKEMANMMENPIHKAMYPTRYYTEEFESDPVDNFWREYINRENHKNTYTNRKITTYQGGEILFAAVGSQITGFGASVRGATEFSGGIVQDDLNKPADIHSQTMRDKVLRYYEETLLSRLNDSNGLILNVQQRLHIEDISGYLERKYKFYTLRKPLIDIHGECQIPSQYTPERIAELKFNDSMFQAQYQQEPIAERGLIIKRDWWKFYDRDATDEHGNIINVVNGQVIMTADTAFKVSNGTDYSCIQVWELRKDKMIMREMLVDKWEFPELIENAKMMWEKWQDPNFLNKAQYFFIEDKASGSPLQQTLLREGINAIAWRPGDYEYPDDKVGRTKTMSWDIFRGMVYLPENDRMSEYLVNEAALFAEDMSHSHDDACFVSTTMIATTKGNKNISDIKGGDYVITPFGKSKVLKTHVREKPVITNIGLTGTPDHKVYCANDYTFDKLENMEYANTSKLTFKELAKWASDLAFYSTVTTTISIQRQDIMNLRTIIKRKNVQQKDFIGRCISFIQEKKYRQTITYIIRTAIKTITLWKTLSCYQIANTLAATAKKLPNVGNVLICRKQMQGEEKNVKSGTIQKKDENGILNTKNNILQSGILKKFALTAAENSIHRMTIENKRYVGDVEINILNENSEKKQKVYNLTVEAGVYYANGVLVSNCDAASMAHSIWKYYGGGSG